MASNDYYNNNPNYDSNPNPGYNNAQPEPKYAPEQSPSYGQQQPPPVPGNKPTFQQAFHLDKPKYNDVWAGILVRRA